MTAPQGGIALTVVAHEDAHLAIARQRGDWGDAYQKKAALLRLSRADMEKLGIKDNSRVELMSDAGSVVVAARSDAAGDAEVGFMPSSLYTNRLAGYDAGSSQLPGGHIRVQVMPTEKPITPISDLKVRRNHA